jgi:SNF2 family DNA or RNA helicase
MIQLYRHQEVILSYLRVNNSFAVFAEPGCGKTLPSLYRILDLVKSGKIKNTLVVGPKSALGAWERDIELFNDFDASLLREAITLINYDRVWRGQDKSKYNKKYDCIILDESHLIKNRTSQRAKFILPLACDSSYNYILTGTPIANGSLEDIWSQYTFLSPYKVKGRVYGKIWRSEWESREPGKTFKGSYQEFLDRYCILNMYHKPSSYVRVRELQEIINTYSYRIKKSECLDLPDKLPDEIVKVDLMEKKLYKKLATESAILEYEILADNPLSRLIKLRQMCAGYISTEQGIIEVKSEKIQILEEIIDSYQAEKKLVIFAEFKYSISQISKLLRTKHIKFVILDGDQKDKMIWRQFQEDKTIRIIVCQYQTANAGIDLFASDTIIYYEPTTRSITLEQSRDRIHRSGQKNTCSYIHLLTKGTVEIDIYRALLGYQDFSEKLFVEYMTSYRKSFSKKEVKS